MAEWLKILEKAKNALSAGNADQASKLLKSGLRRYAKDPNAVQWLTFNLMQSESVLRGPKTAQLYLQALAKSGITWNVKLYTLELALGAASIGDENLDSLYNSALDIIKEFISNLRESSEINVMSCYAIARHVDKLFPSSYINSLFKCTDNVHNYPVEYVVVPHPSGLPLISSCNRLPRVIQTNLEHHYPPERGLGFRRVGKGYLARIGDSTVLFDERGALLDTPYGAYPLFLKKLLEQRFVESTPSKLIKGNSIFIGDYFSHSLNYCHWVVDALVRIVAANSSGLPYNAIVGAFPESQPFQTETLKRLMSKGTSYFGFGSDDGLIEFENLYYADNNTIRHLKHPLFSGDKVLTQSLRDSLQSLSSLKNIGKKLFVPRRHTRRISNEFEIGRLLASYGFETVDTDTMCFADQVQMFSEAAVVVGPHGAALTNILFMPKGGQFLEFFPPLGGSASFFLMCGALELTYSCYIDDTSQGSNRDVTDEIPYNTGDIYVDPSFLEAWLEDL